MPNRTSTWLFSCKFAAYLQNTFSEEHLWVAASAVCYFPKKQNPPLIFSRTCENCQNSYFAEEAFRGSILDKNNRYHSLF